MQIHDETYKGRDITIYTHDNGTCTVDVKHPCGELIEGWSEVESFDQALKVAKLYIYALGNYKKPHCKDEYCSEAA